MYFLIVSLIGYFFGCVYVCIIPVDNLLFLWNRAGHGCCGIIYYKSYKTYGKFQTHTY